MAGWLEMQRTDKSRRGGLRQEYLVPYSNNLCKQGAMKPEQRGFCYSRGEGEEGVSDGKK